MVIPLATVHGNTITPYENTTPSEQLGGCFGERCAARTIPLHGNVLQFLGVVGLDGF